MASATDVYRVVDENGRVYYSQIPPYKGAEKIKLKGSKNTANQAGTNAQENSSASSLQERQQKYSEYLEAERIERKEKREKLKKEKAERASNCHSVRAELDDMNQGGILYYDLDEDGNRVYIEESRVEAKKSNLRDYLKKHCKSIVK